MKIVLQRVLSGSVSVNGKLVSSIEKGLVVLVGIDKNDTETIAAKLAEKIVNIRVFADENGKMNKSLFDNKAAVLSVPQFTLMGNTFKGKRPGFDDAANPEKAKILWEAFNQQIRTFGINIKKGIFGAHMILDIVNDGPVTFILES